MISQQTTQKIKMNQMWCGIEWNEFLVKVTFCSWLTMQEETEKAVVVISE